MTTIELLKNGLDKLKISFSEEQTSAFMTYLSELKKWNRAYNLTALKTDEDIIIKHFLDSLLYLKALPPGTLKLADAGTGAGFPGLPVKIVRPDIELTLIESSRKKCAFLRHITRMLKFSGTTVIEDRLEDLGKEHESCFDYIVSRAAFSIKDFIKLACPYLSEDGKLILNKGPKVSEELDALEGPLYKNAVKETLEIQLPFANAKRNLIVLSCKMNP